MENNGILDYKGQKVIFIRINLYQKILNDSCIEFKEQVVLGYSITHIRHFNILTILVIATNLKYQGAFM